MTNTTVNKIILSATTAMFLTACGGGSGSSTADTEAPVITVPATQTVAFGGTYTPAVATVTDNIDTGLTATISGTVDTHTAGDYTITYTATDAAGNTGTATTVVTVSPEAPDTEAPVITVPATLTVPFGGTYTPAVATVTDNKDTGLTATIGGDTVDVNTDGNYTVTYTATDTAGNVGTASTVVTVTPQYSTTDTTITDALTGLVWDKTASTTCTAPKTEPTIAQFQTILDYTKSSLAIVDGFTLDNDDSHYKTSDGWDIRLKYGHINNTTAATKTICVDASNEIVPTRQALTKDVDTNEVTDPNTGLVWADTATDTARLQKPLADAVAYCTGEGMRLPTLTELNSIYDRVNKKLLAPFTEINNGSGHYWTSTVAEADATQNWTVGFSPTSTDAWSGQVTGTLNTSTITFVRCVKDAE